MTQEVCPRCSAVYEVTLRHFPMRDDDHFDCDVCGARIHSWNSSTVPEYRLVRRPERPPEG
jgi:hypothetical protein